MFRVRKINSLGRCGLLVKTPGGVLSSFFSDPLFATDRHQYNQTVSQQFTLFSIYLINACFLNRSAVFHCALCIVFISFIVHNLKLVLIVSIVCQSIDIVSLFTHPAAPPKAPPCLSGLPVLRSGGSHLVIRPGLALR